MTALPMAKVDGLRIRRRPESAGNAGELQDTWSSQREWLVV